MKLLSHRLTSSSVVLWQTLSLSTASLDLTDLTNNIIPPKQQKTHIFTYGFSFSFITNKFYKRFRWLKHKWKITMMSMRLITARLRSEAPNVVVGESNHKVKEKAVSRHCSTIPDRTNQMGRADWSAAVTNKNAKKPPKDAVLIPFSDPPPPFMWLFHLILSLAGQPR